MTSEDTRGGEVTTLPDLRPLHERACQRFVEYVLRIQPGQWLAPTPCSDWNVRALVDHVVRWNTFVPEFLAGRSLADMVAPFERDILGEDAAAAAAAAVQQAVAAFGAPGALEKIVHHPFGELPGAQVLYLRLFDNTIHAWDLARALSIDASIEPAVAELLYGASLAQRELIRASGHFGPAEVWVNEDMDTQSRLLGLLGRKA
jgi:uncharacterized protein (TIGR03086 family)